MSRAGIFSGVFWLLLGGLVLGATENRRWRNQDGSKSFLADYLSNDGERVTLRRKGRILTFDMTKLHAKDQAWLKKNHPPTGKRKDAPVPKGAAFDQLEFGDSKDDVLKKLRESEFVTGNVLDTLIARVGLDGVFKTKEAVGGLKCSLYFEWTTGDRLREVSLRTSGLEARTYNAALKDNWKEWINLLSMLYGEPKADSGYAEKEDLDDGLMLGSHLWHTEDGHSVILGTGQDGSRYSVVVRITSEFIQPNRY